MKMKKRITPRLLAALTISSMLVIYLIPSPVFAQYAGEVGLTPAALINGSFEDNLYDNVINNYGNDAANDPLTNGSYSHKNVSGWLTTESDYDIELWYNGFHPGTPGSPSAGNYGDIAFYTTPSLDPSIQNNWFAEINANYPTSTNPAPVALYQDVHTIPGSLYEWDFDHRGRCGTDAAMIKLGSLADADSLNMLDDADAQPAASRYYQGYTQNVPRPTGVNPNPTGSTPWNYTGPNPDTYPGPDSANPDPGKFAPTVLVAQRGGNNQLASNWTLHKGYYPIPDGQNVTRFQMEALYSTVNNTATGLSMGNLIDNVNFFPIAAPTQQTIYQYDPNPADPTMSLGYDIDANNNAILDGNGMPTILPDHHETPGFVYVPDFLDGVNISAAGNSGAPYVANAGDSYIVDSSGNVPASLGLYNIPVDIYTTDPYVAYVYDYDSNTNTGQLDMSTPNPDVTTMPNPNDPSQYMALVGTVTSQILVLPRYTVSGTVAGLPNNGGVKITYTYTYPIIDPVTGAQAIDPVTSLPQTGTYSSFATTDASGNYSFTVPAGATLTSDSAPARAGAAAPAAYSGVGAINNNTYDWLNFNALSVQYVDANGNPLSALDNRGLYASTDPYNSNPPAVGSKVTLNGKQYVYQGLYKEGQPSGSDPSADDTMGKPMTVLMVLVPLVNTLTVNFIGPTGNTLQPTTVTDYNNGDPYTTQAPQTITVNGQTYTLQLSTGDSTSGTMDSDKVVTYTYVLQGGSSSSSSSTSSSSTSSSGGSGGSASPKTGDTGTPGLWMFGLIGSAAVVILLAVLWLVRRQKYRARHSAMKNRL